VFFVLGALHRSQYSDGVEVQEAYNNYMRSMRRRFSAWQGLPKQPIVRTILELVGNSKAPADKPACVQGMLLISTKDMNECFKSKGIGMTNGGALLSRTLAGPANPSSTYDSKNRLAPISDERMRDSVENIKAATKKIRGICGLTASSKKLMRFGIRQAWRILIGRDPEPPWILFINFGANDFEKRERAVADKFTAILRSDWYPRGTHPTIPRPTWLPSELVSAQLENVLEWWAKHVLAAGSDYDAHYAINPADATLDEAGPVGGLHNVGASGLGCRGTVRPLSKTGGQGRGGGGHKKPKKGQNNAQNPTPRAKVTSKARPSLAPNQHYTSREFLAETATVTRTTTPTCIIEKDAAAPPDQAAMTPQAILPAMATEEEEVSRAIDMDDDDTAEPLFGMDPIIGHSTGVPVEVQDRVSTKTKRT